MSNLAPWDLYARAMFQSYGYPLWHPDPERDRNGVPREIKLGSVGFVSGGRFRQLFNAMEPAGGQRRVPPRFTPFTHEDLEIHGPEWTILQNYVASGSLQRVEFEGEGSSPFFTNLSAGIRLSFECLEETGAMLLLDGNGIGEEIGNKQAVEDYLSTHIDTWFDWATKKMGYSLKRSDLMPSENLSHSQPFAVNSGNWDLLSHISDVG